jgi:hypothetical protein
MPGGKAGAAQHLTYRHDGSAAADERDFDQLGACPLFARRRAASTDGSVLRPVLAQFAAMLMA